jgi:hypothetical protein
MSATRRSGDSAGDSWRTIGPLAWPVARVAAAVLVGVLLVAGLVAALASDQVRHVIAYRFPGGTLGWRGVAVVMADNARIALAPIAAAYLVELIRPEIGKGWSGWRRALRCACDATLSTAVLSNVVIVGASYGAYGLRMARYTLPYGPFELLAFVCPLTLYLDARRASPPRARALALCGMAAVVLTASALMESLLPPL